MEVHCRLENVQQGLGVVVPEHDEASRVAYQHLVLLPGVQTDLHNLARIFLVVLGNITEHLLLARTDSLEKFS